MNLASAVAKTIAYGGYFNFPLSTEPNTLWFTRPLFLFFLSLFFNRRHPGDNSSIKIKNAFCPNLWLDMFSLTVPKKRQNIYTAHEVLQVRPLFDRGGTYQNFIRSNRWTSHYLANAYHKLSDKKYPKKKSNPLFFIIAPLNYLLFILQYFYMLPKKTTEVVSLHAAYFHKNDLSTVLTNYLKNN